MAYCTYTELTNLTGSSLSQTVLEQIITLADYEIDAYLRANGINSGDSGDLKAASLKLSIAGVITRHRMDGTMPASLTVGGISASDNPDQAIAALNMSAYDILRGIVRKNRSYRQVLRVVNRC